MRVGLIVPGGVDRSGRVRVIPVLLALIERLSRRHDVVVVTLNQEDDPSEYPLLGARVIDLGQVSGAGARRWLGQYRRLMAALRTTGGLDVLHAFWLHSPGTLALAAGALLRVPVVLSLGGGELVWLPEIRYGSKSTLLRRSVIHTAVHMASAVTAGSRYSLSPLAALRRNAKWLPLGVDARLFCSPPARPPGPPWRLLQVADINAVKDQTTLLHAVRAVCNSGCEIYLDCIGVDTLGGRVQALAGELGLAQVVRFHGRIPLDEVIPFYSRAHLFVQSSRHESMGAAVLEAAAAGVPTVGTNVGIAAEMAPLAALTVPVGDPSGLADAIRQVLNCQQRRESMARAAQTFARTYDADWTCAQMEAIYRQIT